MFDDILTPQQISRKGQTFINSGLDNEEACYDLQWYRSYPDPISYKINSMGFRDQDHESLENKIVAIGDSFTMGIGQPYEDTWPVILENMIGEPIVKFASDGVSNDWIFEVFNRAIALKPRAIFVMLTFVHREMVKKSDHVIHLHYDEHASYYHPDWAEKMLYRTVAHVDNMTMIAERSGIPIFFTAVPGFDAVLKSPEIRDRLISYKRMSSNAPPIIFQKFKDLARDGFHFGNKTCTEIANNLYKQYNDKKGVK